MSAAYVDPIETPPKRRLRDNGTVSTRIDNEDERRRFSRALGEHVKFLDGRAGRPANFSGGDFAYFDLSIFPDGVPLSRATLTGADFTGAIMPKAQLQQARLNCSDLTDANLEGADLSGADLRGARLDGACLAEANLDGADLGPMPLAAEMPTLTRLLREGVTRAQARNADFSGAAMKSASLAGADLSGSKLIGATLDGADFGGAILLDADIEDAALARATPMTGSPTQSLAERAQSHQKWIETNGQSGERFASNAAHLVELNWRARDLRNADFRGSRIVDCCLAASQLDQADFSDCTLEDVDFEDAQLRGVSFRRARLIGCRFDRALIAALKMAGTEYLNTSFNNATIVNCSFIDTTIQKVSFKSVTACTDTVTALGGANVPILILRKFTVAPAREILELKDT